MQETNQSASQKDIRIYSLVVYSSASGSSPPWCGRT